MDDKERVRVLEAALQQMLQPVKNIPLNVVIKSLSGNSVIKFDKTNSDDLTLLNSLRRAIKICADDVKKNPIRRPRPNEVGNDIEEYVLKAMSAVGLTVTRPTSRRGKGKNTGYPDLLLHDAKRRPTYLECKIFADGKDPSTMRSFYLSPSESFKVSMDARHLLLAYGMQSVPVAGSDDRIYRASSFKLVDLHDLLCDVKYEFNSDNRRLYSEIGLLAEGEV